MAITFFVYETRHIHRVGGEMENKYYDDDLINLTRTGNSQSRLYWTEQQGNSASIRVVRRYGEGSPAQHLSEDRGQQPDCARRAYAGPDSRHELGVSMGNHARTPENL